MQMTHAKVLENKDIIHGVSIHYVDDGLDEGPLIAQGEISINAHDDIDKVIERIHKIEHDLFPYIIKLICNNLITLDENKILYSDDIELNDKNIIIKNMIYKLIPVLLLSLTINAEVKNYSAEYEFISEEITIAGTRALDINESLVAYPLKQKTY